MKARSLPGPAPPWSGQWGEPWSPLNRCASHAPRFHPLPYPTATTNPHKSPWPHNPFDHNVRRCSCGQWGFNTTRLRRSIHYRTRYLGDLFISFLASSSVKGRYRPIIHVQFRLYLLYCSMNVESCFHF